MKRGLPAWVEAQAVRALPGTLFALALALPAWRYRLLWHTGPEAVYFELRDGFLYLSDLPALVAVVAWLLSPFPRRAGRLPRWLVAALAGLGGMATLSAIWAPLPSLALYQAARLWLLLAIFLIVATTPEARGALAWGLVASGAVQAGIGIAQFLLQRTLGLRQFGELVMQPGWSGASVITVNGVPTLRAYGLTQHPNLLGGILMAAVLIGMGLAVGLASEAQSGSKRHTDAARSRQPGRSLPSQAGVRPAPVSFARLAPISDRRLGWQLAPALAGILTAICFAGLLLTFSRAAWLGTAVGGLVMLILLLRRPVRPSVAWPAAAALVVVLAVVGVIFLATQWPLLRPRLGLSVEGVEIRSADERSGLETGAWTLIREHPWLGVGYGNFSLALWQRKPAAMAAYPIYQPVHRVPLLAAAELGIPGALLWLILALGPWIAIWRRRSWPLGLPQDGLHLAARTGVSDLPSARVALAAGIAAAIAALTAVSWFDFYPWFSQQGRLLMWICWGLLAQSLTSNE